MLRIIQVTLCAAAYTNLDSDTITEIDPSLISDVIPVDEDQGVGRSIIFFHDGSTANVMESVDDLAEFW